MPMNTPYAAGGGAATLPPLARAVTQATAQQPQRAPLPGAPGKSFAAEATNLPPSVEAVAQQQRTHLLGALDEGFTAATSSINSKVEAELHALNNQYVIKRDFLKRQFDKHKADPEKQQSIIQQLEQVQTQFIGRAQAAKDKVHPDVIALQQEYEQKKAQLVRQFEMQDLQLNVIRSLVDRGLDPAFAQQQQLRILGMDIPMSAFKRGNTLEQSKTALEDDIRNAQNLLEARFIPPTGHKYWGVQRNRGVRYIDPISGDKRELDPKNEQDKLLLEEYKLLTDTIAQKESDYIAVVAENDPLVRKIAERRAAYQRALNALSKSNEKGGGIGPSLIKEVNKQSGTRNGLPPIGDAIKDLASRGYDQNQIRDILLYMGYK